MLTNEQHKIIADVIELAGAEHIEYSKEDLILFAKGKVERGCSSVDKILSDFTNLGEY